MLRFLFIGLTLFIKTAPCLAQDPADTPNTDVKFIVLGKAANHRQVTEGVYALLNYHFFAEIFLEQNGIITDARLSLVNDDAEAMLFENTPPVLTFHGGHHTSAEALNKAYPDGEYIFSYVPGHGQLVQRKVQLGNSADKMRFPFPVVIYLSQDGQAIDASAIDPDKDLAVAWSPFASGKADANKISDDLIFAVTSDCHGTRIDHSGLPLGEYPHLTFASSQHSVSASKLYPGESFQIFVEHADIETSGHAQAPGMAAYTARTFVDIKTLGGRLPERAPCPDLMPAMDGGQTDRPRLEKIAIDP